MGFSLDDIEELHGANVFFSVYKELDGLFKCYGFDKDKDRIMFDHEVGTPNGLCTYFRISEKLDLFNGNGSETLNFFIGAYLRASRIHYQIESINTILYTNSEIHGGTAVMPIISQKYSIENGPLPTRYQIRDQIEELLKIRRIREKFGMGANKVSNKNNTRYKKRF